MKKISPQQRGRPITRNPAHVLETAMNAYWRDDRAAVSLNAVCALAGVSKPSLYRDFGSEDGLTSAVLEQYRQTVLVSLEALLSSPQNYRTKLDALISFASDDPQMEASDLAATYLQEQIGLAVTQRAEGKSPASVRALLELAVSALS